RRGRGSGRRADRRDPRQRRGSGGPSRVPRTAQAELVTTLLVANRGEIARRIIRTARRLGMRAVAAYSDADAGLPFVREADAAVAKAARDTGYPLMIKPLAGGGGIGMQTVREERALGDALTRARRLAASAFGDERLLLERLVERPRHIEVQILADSHGEVQAV